MVIDEPEAVGMSSLRLERIPVVMQKYIDQGKLAGLITMIARNGKLVHFETMGMMDIEAAKPMQSDTIVRLYSMTKPITSTAVMILYEEGAFLLDDPISDFIPEFNDVEVFANDNETSVELTELERPITVWDLLTHTSGLGYGFLGNLPVQQMYREAKVPRSDATLEQNIQNLIKLPLFHQPGERFWYSISYDVLGYLIELISGTSFAEFLNQRVFEPLGMEDTGFSVPRDKMGRLASMYGLTEKNELQAIDVPMTSPYLRPSICPSGGGGLFETDPSYLARQTPTSYGASGGLVSTASDYFRFAQMLLNAGELDGMHLLSRKTVGLMIANHLAPEILPSYGWNGHGCGFGFDVIIDVTRSEPLWSEGAFAMSGSASTMFWVDPKEELIGIVMPQLQPYNLRIGQQFQVLAYQAIID